MSNSHLMYNAAPLPFMGQKRRFAKEFIKVLHTANDVNTVVDLFGGSGLLSHITKRELPECHVVYNDYDYFSTRIANVDRTNRLLAELRPVVNTIPKNQKLPTDIKQRVLDIIAEHAKRGYVDYLTLSSSLLFSGKWETSFAALAKQMMYNCMRQNDYCVDGYLDGLEVVHKDYKELFAEYVHCPKTLFLIDPPYLSTEVGAYQCYWRLSDYLDVLKTLQGTKYIYFTSEKSQLIELCSWLAANPTLANPFSGAVKHTQSNNVNYNSAFTDIMMVRI